MRRRRLIAQAGAILVVSAILSYWLRGDYKHQLFVELVLPPLVVIAVISWRMGRLRLVIPIVVGLLSSWLVGKLLHEWDMAAARSYCERLSEAADAFHREHGRYAEHISALEATDAHRPRLLEDDPDIYHAAAGGYVVSFEDPDGRVPHAWVRTHEDRQWSRW